MPTPHIEFHSSNLSYGEKLLLKKYRRANKNTQEFFSRRTPIRNMTSREQHKATGNIHVNRSFPGNINWNGQDIEIEVSLSTPFNESYLLLHLLASLR